MQVFPHLLDHLVELFHFVLAKVPVVLHGGHVKLVLRLGLGRLKGAGQDGQLDFAKLLKKTRSMLLAQWRGWERAYLWHLWMREVLVDDDTLDKHGVLHPAPNLGLHLDELKVDILAVNVGHGEHGIHGNLRHLAVTLVDDLGAQGGHGRLHEVLRILGINGELLRHLVKVLTRALGRQLEPIGNPDGVDALVDERLRLLQEGSAQHDHPRSPVADLVILRLRQLHQKLGNLENRT